LETKRFCNALDLRYLVPDHAVNSRHYHYFDRASAGEYQDLGGPALKKRRMTGWQVAPAVFRHIEN
jgi:hypothetical protein